MVEIEHGQYLLDMMRRMGPTVSNGFGTAPRPDAEILAYAQGIGVTLEPFEFHTLRDMCRAYIGGLRSAEDKFSKAPIDRET